MEYKKDGEEPSGILVPKKEFSNSFDGAHIKIVSIGGNVFEKSDKSVKEVMDETHEDEAPQPVRSVVNPFVITREKIGRCIKAVQKHFWGSSCYTVVFCVYRDKFSYKGGMKRFEDEMQSIIKELNLDFTCPENTLSNTVYHNKFMRYSIDKWEGCQARKRLTPLAEHILNAMETM